MINFLRIIITLIVVTSCSIAPENESKDSLTDTTVDEERIERPLCKYVEVKGISELIDISSSDYNFIFFPGDNQFEISRIKISTLFTENEIMHLSTRKEIKSIKRRLILGHENCSEFEFELMPF